FRDFTTGQHDVETIDRFVKLFLPSNKPPPISFALFDLVALPLKSNGGVESLPARTVPTSLVLVHYSEINDESITALLRVLVDVLACNERLDDGIMDEHEARRYGP